LQDRRIAFLFFAFLLATIFSPASTVIASGLRAPKYPNLEPFTVEANPIDSYYSENGGGLTPSFHFPELQDLDAYTMHRYGPLTTTGGNFIISGTTGPDGTSSEPVPVLLTPVR